MYHLFRALRPCTSGMPFACDPHCSREDIAHRRTIRCNLRRAATNIITHMQLISSWHPRLNLSKHPLPQEPLNGRLVMAFQHDMASQLIDHSLVARQTQQLSQLISQYFSPSIDLSHPRELQAASSFPQSVDRKLVIWSPADKVRQVWCAEVRS